MSIWQLFIFAAVAILVGHLTRARALTLLGVSAFLMYWLQSPQENVTLAFWFPTATLALTVLAWLLTSSPEVREWRRNWPAVLVLAGVVVLVDSNRYFKFDQILNTETPRIQWVGALIAILLISAFLITRLRESPSVLLIGAVIGLIVLFVLVKMPPALHLFFKTVATLRGKEINGSITFAWLGFSYVVFRLLHTILDRKAGRLSPVPLAEYVNYVIFFPSLSAGPIDRLERFTHDLTNPVVLDRAGWTEAGSRFFLGLFKKFVVADVLAWVALRDPLSQQVSSSLWMWVLLYSYSLRLYFDFSGYTDIAIGLGRLAGVCLPENFASPYLKQNLTQFWNSWHMTLTQWFRSYFFNPLIRATRSNKQPLPAYLVIWVAQISTMILIGLWHGITAGFLFWGLWHGTGLFVQNRWSNYMKDRLPFWAKTGLGQALLKCSGVFLTFNFVSLGWLFFALPSSAKVWSVMAILFGIA